MDAKYDTIGLNHAQLRRPDPRIAAVIARALGPARTVLNVGADAGSYEPTDRRVTALERSREMIRKRPEAAAPAIQAGAERLPFADRSFDASMAVLTVHHWADKAAGLREMRRVTRGPVVLLTFDPAARPWLTTTFPRLPRSTTTRCRREPDTVAGWARCGSRLRGCRTIAATASSMPIGGGPPPISTR